MITIDSAFFQIVQTPKGFMVMETKPEKPVILYGPVSENEAIEYHKNIINSINTLNIIGC